MQTTSRRLGEVVEDAPSALHTVISFYSGFSLLLVPPATILREVSNDSAQVEEDLRASDYDASEVEGRWQRAWREAGVFATEPESDGAEQAWILSGSTRTYGETQVGRLRSEIIADAFARFQRAQGREVLFAPTFSSLGPKAASEAVERGVSGPEWVASRAARMREALDRLGCSFDWERSSMSSDPEVYRWTQRLFLLLLENDLVHRQTTEVDWCESCRTALAPFQCDGGACEICGGEIRAETRTEWFLRVSRCTGLLDRGLSEPSGWPPGTIAMQRAVSGQVDGVEMDAQIVGVGTVTVFTPHTEAVESAAFVALAPSHPLVTALAENPELSDAVSKARQAGQRRASEREREHLVQVGLQAQVPGVSQLLPVVIAASVAHRYGETAVLGIPGEDETDRLLAERIDSLAASTWKLTKMEGRTRPAQRVPMSDFPISRQLPFGTPVPVVDCPTCGPVSVPVDDLPVRLADNTQADAADSGSPDRAETPCPGCGAAARPDGATLDPELDEAWLWLLPCVPAADRATTMFDHPDLPRRLPVKQLVCGADRSRVVFLQRVIARALQETRQLPRLEAGEPFAGLLLHGEIRPASESPNRFWDPEALLEDFSGDAVRFGLLDAASPRKELAWNDEPVRYGVRFLGEVWNYAEPRLRSWGDAAGVEDDEDDQPRQALARWCRIGLEKVAASYEDLEMQRAIYNLSRLFARIKGFEEGCRERRGEPEHANRAAIHAALMDLVQALSPIAPHLAEQLWERGGGAGLVSAAPWPLHSFPV